MSNVLVAGMCGCGRRCGRRVVVMMLILAVPMSVPAKGALAKALA